MRGETSKLGWEWEEKQVNYDEKNKVSYWRIKCPREE